MRAFAAAALFALSVIAPVSATENTYTPQQVSAHAVGSDCWTIVRDVVYDLTAWVLQHPHGEADILGMCGNDGTAGFESEHLANTEIAKRLDAFRIGYLAGATSRPTPSISATPQPDPSASAQPKPLARSVTCSKGRQTKKFSGSRCPSGWKPKKK